MVAQGLGTLSEKDHIHKEKYLEPYCTYHENPQTKYEGNEQKCGKPVQFPIYL